MKQYLDLLQTIKDKGTCKPAARENMPGTQSLFGYQFRHNLADGFPLLTTKKINFKNVVTELLWFLRGDTNIKYLVDNGCNIWNEDAYNYYQNICKDRGILRRLEFTEFVSNVKSLESSGREYNETENLNGWEMPKGGYVLGDCGFQYGRVWRNWFSVDTFIDHEENISYHKPMVKVDQISSLIRSLRKNPESRRHILTAIDPAHDVDLALYWCHAMSQFNCRPLTIEERIKLFDTMSGDISSIIPTTKTLIDIAHKNCDENNIPKYYLDCQMYQRSADVVLGVPYNLASYALLTHILAKMCNMIPGEFIHTFGDVHIYDNHREAVEEQLTRSPKELPKLILGDNIDWTKDIDNILSCIELMWDNALDNFFKLENYNPESLIKAELSTGMKK